MWAYNAFIVVVKVYYISRGILKTANKQYSKLDNDYEMTFTNDTVIEPCQEEDNSLPHMNVNFLKLADLMHKSANDFVGTFLKRLTFLRFDRYHIN